MHDSKLLLLFAGVAHGLLIPGVPPRVAQRTRAAVQASASDGTKVADPVGFAVGIDLGTTTSSIAVAIDGRPKVIHSLLSVVRPGSGEEGGASEVVGDTSSDAPGALSSAKRLIGRTYAEASAVLPRHSALRRALVPLPLDEEGVDDVAAELDLGDDLDEEGFVAGSPATRRRGGGGGAAAGMRCSNAPGGALSPEWVSSRVLKTLIDASEAATGVRARRAVIGVPAHFGPRQRDATRAAAALAGIETVKLIVEPVAAALAYDVMAASPGAVQGGGAFGGAADRDEVVCVYDLGGGTLDVSILQLGGGTAEVLGSAGEPWLGGDDFDAAVASMLAKRAGWPASAASDSRLVSKARDAKEQLTVRRAVNVTMPSRPVRSRGEVAEEEVAAEAGEQGASAEPSTSSDDGAEQAGVVVLELTRNDLNKACSTLISNLRTPLVRAAAACHIPLKEPRVGSAPSASVASVARRTKAEASRPSLRGKRIDRALLVGAASRMPLVATLVEEITGVRCDMTSVRPEDAVACGAAVQAAILQGEIEQYDVFTVLEAALIRGVVRGNKGSQRERKEEGVKKKRRRAR